MKPNLPMKPNFLFAAITVFLLSFITCEKVYAQKTYELDNSHASLIFSISHFNIGYVYGRFNKVSGTFSIDDEAANCKFDFEIDPASIDTNDKGRDQHLKGIDFFDIANHPKIEFASKSVSVADNIYSVVGKMKILGVEREVKIPFQQLGVGKGPFGASRMGMIGKFRIKRSEFGMNAMMKGIGDEVAITFAFEGIAKSKTDDDR